MSDIYSAQKLTHQAIVVSSTKRVTSGGTWSQSTAFQHGGRQWNGTNNGSARTTLLATIARDELVNLARWGLINPATVVWELVPFSFVVDWFAPVGNTLDALTSGVGLESNGGWTSVQTGYDLSAYQLETEKQNPDTYTIVTESGGYSEEYFAFDRIAYTAFPRATFYADSTPLSPLRAANALALMKQLVF